MGAVFSLLVALDPVGLARTWPKRLEVAAVASAVLAIAVVLAEPVLDLLDLSPEGFWIAAGIVLLVPGLARLVGGRSTRDVAGPGAALVAIALSTRDGVGTSLVAVGVAAVVTLLALRFVEREARWIGVAERVIGGLMVVVAFDLIRDGVIAV